MYKKNEEEGSPIINDEEHVVTSTNGYNENTIYKPSNYAMKLAEFRKNRLELSIADELNREPILLEQGGYLESED